jgi:hypothetical protein
LGTVNEKELENAIDTKSRRELLSFEKAPRQRILDYIQLQGPSTINDMAKNLSIKPNKVRYESLRLVQLNKLVMDINPEMGEPQFSIKLES